MASDTSLFRKNCSPWGQEEEREFWTKQEYKERPVSALQ